MSVGSSNFDDIAEQFALGFEFLMKGSESWQKDSMGFKDGCDMHDCWEAIIAGLASVDMIIRMYSITSSDSTKNLLSSVGDDFIGVHI